MIALAHRELLPENVVIELDQLISGIRAYLFVQHKEDGSHGDVTADSLVVSGDTTLEGPVDIDADTEIDGKLTVLNGLDVYGNANFFDNPEAAFSSAVRSDLPVEMSRAPFWPSVPAPTESPGAGDAAVGGNQTIEVNGEDAISEDDSPYFTHFIITSAINTPELTGVRTADGFGLTTDEAGRLWFLTNRTGTSVTLLHASGLTTGLDFRCPNNQDFELVPGATVAIVAAGVAGFGGEALVFGSDTGRWKAYTPSWTSTGTQPSLGDGSLSGRFAKIGKTVFYSISLVMGSTTTFGTGNYRFSLPVQANASSTLNTTGRFIDASPSTTYLGVVFGASTTTVALFAGTAPAAAVTNTSPWTWAQNDIIIVQGTYEAA